MLHHSSLITSLPLNRGSRRGSLPSSFDLRLLTSLPLNRGSRRGPLLLLLLSLLPLLSHARQETVCSPNGQLVVTINDDGGHATYAVSLDSQPVILPSALGFKADFGDFTQGLTITSATQKQHQEDYQMWQAKQSNIHVEANLLTVTLSNAAQQHMSIEFFVKNNDVAFRYLIPQQKEERPKMAVIERELTAFSLPDGTTTFLTPQINPMTGWERTKPSYEEEYIPDAPLTAPSRFGQGFTFPCLFHLPSSPSLSREGRGGSKGRGGSWLLISETGVDSHYCGSHLSDYPFTIAYPQQGENNGFGSPTASIPLPGSTPWRTITIGTSLQPIVETTIPYDVVTPLYPLNYSLFTIHYPLSSPSPSLPREGRGGSPSLSPSLNREGRGGSYTWSWLIWQDNSINYADQLQFIDLAAEMGYELCLVDNWWDQNIGRERIAELSRYAQQKGVSLMLWYNSNGHWNDAPQTPRNCMDTPMARDREMQWLQSIGVKGIKVDFFAGDKQETMALYEAILYDANRYGIQVIFHGCTLPRGWERMYPNFVASEAVLASENVYFSAHHAEQEPFQLTMHPFCRNAVASMDWGGVIMNKYMSRDNKSRHQRQTTDVFEMATAFTNQTAVQCIAIQPNNLQELPPVTLDFLKHIPTVWDETRFIDGYPGQYVVLARRHGTQWYIAALNAKKEPLRLTLDLRNYPVTTLLTDVVNKKTKALHTAQQPVKPTRNGTFTLLVQPRGGAILF